MLLLSGEKVQASDNWQCQRSTKPLSVTSYCKGLIPHRQIIDSLHVIRKNSKKHTIQP
jgi:hypothetical protein